MGSKRKASSRGDEANERTKTFTTSTKPLNLCVNHNLADVFRSVQWSMNVDARRYDNTCEGDSFVRPLFHNNGNYRERADTMTIYASKDTLICVSNKDTLTGYIFHIPRSALKNTTSSRMWYLQALPEDKTDVLAFIDMTAPTGAEALQTSFFGDKLSLNKVNLWIHNVASRHDPPQGSKFRKLGSYIVFTRWEIGHSTVENEKFIFNLDPRPLGKDNPDLCVDWERLNKVVDLYEDR